VGAGTGDLRGNFSANGPEHDHVLPSLVVNPFVEQVVAERYAEARPRLHGHVVALLVERVPAPDRALDMGCGPGLSTKPLTSFARVVVGVDVSKEMLTARADDGDAHFVRARAERLPFRDDAFDLATAASAIRWFGSETIDEIGRVLKSNAWLMVYDVRFCSEMVGEEAFAQWMEDECAPRYPVVPKHEFTSTSVASIGFVPTWEADLRFDLPMTQNMLVAYLMTHSERIAAVHEGRETEAQQEAYLTEAVRRFFPDAKPRLLGFGIPIEVFSR
jgi:ubiquinone/menaquinone biosynthesis C-methylase UbiE